MAKTTASKIKKKPRADYNLVFKFITGESSENSKTSEAREFFRQLFKDQFTYEGDAEGADGYVRGRLVLELKTKHEDWLAGLYQALHYAKKGLGFAHVAVMSHRFIGLWRLSKLPEPARIMAHQTPPLLAPNEVGQQNAKRTNKGLKQDILDSADFLFNLLKDPSDDFSKGPTTASFAFLQKLHYLDEERIPVTPNNFINVIEQMKTFFDRPIDAVHAFYDIVHYWDITSNVGGNESEPDQVRVVGKAGSWFSDPITLSPSLHAAFKSFIRQHYVFTNEGSGLTTDYYFSRFDEVIQKIDPEYVKQHGIFFTSHNLSKFALWFVDNYFDSGLTDKYIVVDPAGGSGNLVSSWRNHVQHKIVSELQPDLLRIIDKRMKADPWEVQTGFTIVPKASTHEGLNFLDKPASEYYQLLKGTMKEHYKQIDKPFAYLLNPPYKNTDENDKVKEKHDAAYGIDPSIIEITGRDAGNERYLAFLGQIHRLTQEQVAENPNFRPVLLVFTPTSWLIPRPTYRPFREIFDTCWEYMDGFIVTSNQFFKLKGEWPLSFTIWRWRENADDGICNEIIVRDLTHLSNSDLALNWAENEDFISMALSRLLDKAEKIHLSNKQTTIISTLPMLVNSDGEEVKQSRLNIYRNRIKAEKDSPIVSGFPLADPRHNTLKVPYGYADGNYVGFMDNLTPVRITQDTGKRLSNKPDRVWFYLDTRVIGLNISKAFSCPPDKYGFCAYDLASAKATFTWFAITKALNGNYPVWFNQFSLWGPDFSRYPDKVEYFHQLCFAYALAENRCIVTLFEADNPMVGAPEIFVDNPLCPINPDSFWSTVLNPRFAETNADDNIAANLVNVITNLYKHWNLNHCHGQVLKNVGLHDEPYFKYFAYHDFLTPRSGLVQIRKHAEQHPAECFELMRMFEGIRSKTTAVRKEIYRLLVEDFKYFS